MKGDEEKMTTLSNFLIENAIDVGIIEVEGERVAIPGVDTLGIAMERLDEVITKLGGMTTVIDGTKNELEDYVARYTELIENIPKTGGLNNELPQDLIENYRKATIEVKELGIPLKLRRGEKLNMKEQLAWLDWKNLKATKDFISGGNNKIWEQIEELHDYYEKLIRISRNNIGNLDLIGERMGMFTQCAAGVQDLLRTLSEMPREMINMGDLLMNLQGLTSSYMQTFSYCTEKALNLDTIVDGAELTGNFGEALSKVVVTSKEKVKEAKEKGVDANLINDAEGETALLEELEREARGMMQ